jgi:hypothetical protein
MKTGTATITLDYGKCPKWLFERIKTLGGIMAEIIIEEFGTQEFLKRSSHPVWFQTFGSLLAFDWNSSGLTVVLTAALKEAFRERNLGIYFAGGKGKTSRKTPDELLFICEKIGLDGEKYAQISKLTAKVDNSLIQDGFNLYHHSFIITEKGDWAVVQQGMNTERGLARRYHWYNTDLTDLTRINADNNTRINADNLNNTRINADKNTRMHADNTISDNLRSNNPRKSACENTIRVMRIRDNQRENPRKSAFTEEPHSGIASDIFLKKVLNLTSKESRENKEGMIKVLNEENKIVKEMEKVLTRPEKNLFLPDVEFHWHPVAEERFDLKRLTKTIEKVKFLQPKTMEELLLIEGVGPKTIRALSLVSEVIYGAKPSFEDPARYTFAHGGKDGTPYPVDRQTYDETIKIFNKALMISKQRKLFT